MLNFIIAYIVIPIILLFIIRKIVNGPFTKLRKSMKGKVVIITGSSAGLGKETALQLLMDGAEVIFACRDKVKTMKIINNNEKAHFIKLDLNSFQDVIQFAEEVKKKFSKIDILINNAGGFPTDLHLTKNNIEFTFQSNHLSHMLLSLLLLDHFDKDNGRIINVSSNAHHWSDFVAGNIHNQINSYTGSTFERDYFRNFWRKFVLYGNTKIAQIYFSQNFSKFLEINYPGVKIASVHPGAVNTEISRTDNQKLIFRLFKYLLVPIFIIFFKTCLAGAQTQLHLCYLNFSSFVNGAYYTNCKVTKTDKRAKDLIIENEVVKESWKLIKENLGKIDNFYLKERINKNILEYLEK
jgi:retinol dehydrogenase-12